MNPQMPSAKGLLIRTAVAALIGLILVVCVIMPAEYRRDPTGFGRATGLLELTTPVAANPAAAVAGAEGSAQASDDDVPPVVTAADIQAPTYKTEWRTDTIDIPIGPDGELEYKVKMKPGATLIYSWKTNKGTVYYDFHGEPEGNPDGSKSYIQVQETKAENGSLIAPFEGIHGWYWLNLTGEPIVITLKMSGFYELKGVI